jgi:hypothetical protein
LVASSCGKLVVAIVVVDGNKFPSTTTMPFHIQTTTTMATTDAKDLVKCKSLFHVGNCGRYPC